MVKCQRITTLYQGYVRAQALGASLAMNRLLETERAILRAVGVPVALD